MKFALLFMLSIVMITTSSCSMKPETPERQQVKPPDSKSQPSKKSVTPSGYLPPKPLQTKQEPLRSSQPLAKPLELSIPAIHVQAEIEPVKFQENGQMGVPTRLDRVGVLQPGVNPGEQGNAIMDGHVDSRTGPAVFFRLKRLKSGDSILIKDKQGQQLTYIVETVEAFKTEEAPIARIFGPTTDYRLNLITCTGKFSRSKREHEMRLVVFAKLKHLS
ncbi:class F sortase [Paenibacillus sp. PR3]|uniref:Class F sortase n=1 Tax=Paenibacillus terricola TaxID=2763503 RepID=A0ABR8MTH5_9BACL|nr:class F sortase [Paenibacillus terricola]MBD3919273.1 class F sortase [Paenibacillus terricola]